MIMLGLIKVFGSSLKKVTNERRNRNYDFGKAIQCIMKKNDLRSKSGETRSEQELRRRQEDYDYQERKKLGLDSIFHFEGIKFSMFDFMKKGEFK